MECIKNNFAYPNFCKCEKCEKFRLDVAREILPNNGAISKPFNDGASCFVMDDNCYVLMNYVNGEWVKSAHLFKAAVEVLNKLTHRGGIS
jgi:hypothetical protein